jgi:hypothetical protein
MVVRRCAFCFVFRVCSVQQQSYSHTKCNALQDPCPCLRRCLRSKFIASQPVVWYTYTPIKKRGKKKRPLVPTILLSCAQIFWAALGQSFFRAYGASNLRNLVHVGIVVGSRGSLGCSGGGGSSAVGLVAAEVVLHFGVQLLGGLWLGLSSTSGLLLVGGTSLRSTGSTVGGTLCSLRGSTLGLLLSGGLGLAVMVSVLAPSGRVDGDNLTRCGLQGSLPWRRRERS